MSRYIHILTFSNDTRKGIVQTQISVETIKKDLNTSTWNKVTEQLYPVTPTNKNNKWVLIAHRLLVN